MRKDKLNSQKKQMVADKNNCIPIQLEPIPLTLFILLSLVINLIKRSDLENYKINTDVIIEAILNHCKKKKTKDYKTLNDVYDWIKKCLEIEINHRKNLAVDTNHDVSELLTNCLSSIVKEIDDINTICSEFEKCSGNKMNCAGNKLYQMDYCPKCIEKQIRAFAEDLYASRLYKDTLPMVDFKSSYFSVEWDRVSSFKSGKRPWIGIKATCGQEEINGPYHVFLQFNPQYYHLKDYLICPYLVLHEYAVHGVTNTDEDKSGRRDEQKNSVFYEGWLDYTIFNYLKKCLSDCYSDELSGIELPYTGQKILISLGNSRKNSLEEAHSYRKNIEISPHIVRGARSARKFQHFLHHECKSLFPSAKCAENAFDQISCDIALMQNINREELVVAILRALESGGDEHRKYLKICIENSLTQTQNIKPDLFIRAFSRYAEKNQSII